MGPMEVWTTEMQSRQEHRHTSRPHNSHTHTRTHTHTHTHIATLARDGLGIETNLGSSKIRPLKKGEPRISSRAKVRAPI